MKKKITISILGLLVVFVIIQFFQPKKNNIAPDSNHLFNSTQLPSDIKTIFQNACLDCHSNQTTYLWYHKIAPVSWVINSDINDGKEELNLSEWEQLSVIDKISKLNKICREVKNDKMPLKAYVFMHKKARLTEEQRAALCTWSEKLSEELISKR